MTLALPSAPDGPSDNSTAAPAVNRRVVALALALIALLAYLCQRAAGTQMAVLLGIGTALGVVLYHAAFGFTGSWRALLVQGKGAGLRAQMLMLAVAVGAFLPLLELGSVFGQTLSGSIAPVGVSVVVGAFLFGAGMQLGGACASGTLFTTGGGSPRMFITLLFFLVGSLLGSLHLPWWLEQPRLPAMSLQGELGMWPAVAASWAVFGAIALATVWVERRVHGTLVGPGAPPHRGWRRLLRGPWPLVAGGLGLAGLNVATLAVSGHPWSVSFGYTLWGAKIGQALGLDVASWPFWTWAYPKAALAGSVFAEDTSVMNLGILAGALLAAGLAGRFAPVRRILWQLVLASAVGGTLMGYGARLAFGCNIGAMFSGIASGSLHGWLWLVCALAGNWAGVYLRPVFGMARG